MLPEQVGIAESILATTPAPLTAVDFARSFQGRCSVSFRLVLNGLGGVKDGIVRLRVGSKFSCGAECGTRSSHRRKLHVVE